MDVRKTVTDSGYIAIGIAVLGAEQASSTAQHLGTRTADAVAPARSKLSASSTDLRKRISPAVDDTRSRVADETALRSQQAKQLAHDLLAWSDEIVVRMRERLSPLVERLPEPARKASASWNDLVDSGRARVRDLVDVPAAA